jgi:hypothetical protein
VSAFTKLAEQRINEAMKRGEFRDLPGRGRELSLEDYFRTPADVRLAYHILKNADCLPPDLDIKIQISRIEDLIPNLPDERERLRQMRRLNYLVMKLNMVRPTRVEFEEDQLYYGRLLDRLGAGRADRKKDTPPEG